MIKLVVTDVDGTLVGDGKMQLNPEYFDVIRALVDKGIHVVMASGRTYDSIREIIEPVKDLVWYISDSGCTIKTDHGFESTSELPHDLLREFIKDVRKVPGLSYFLSDTQYSYLPEKDTLMYNSLTYQYHYNTVYVENLDEVPNGPYSKITLFRETDIETYANEYLTNKWSKVFNMAKSGTCWIDCTMPGINKASALQVIMERLGVSREEVMATGDNQNDIEMIQYAGVGLGVASAHPDLKAVANAIIPSYKEDGVLQEWKKLL